MLRHGLTAAIFAMTMILTFALVLVGGCAPTTGKTAHPPSALLSPEQPAVGTERWDERFSRTNAAAAMDTKTQLADQRRVDARQRAAGLVPMPSVQRHQAPPLPVWQPARCWLLTPRPCLLCKPVHPNPNIASLALDASC